MLRLVRKDMLRISGKTSRNVLISCALVIFCLNLTIAAQSRRQTKENTAPTQQTVTVETKSAATDDKTQDDKKPLKILSLKVVGEFQQNLGYFKSNHLDNALKEFIRALKDDLKSTTEATKGGKMSYTEAKEQAKKETGTFILWLGYAAKADQYGSPYVDYVQYAILKPETGEVVTRSQIEPLRNRLPNPGGGTVRLPTVNRSWDLHKEMNKGSRDVAEILVRGDWLD